MFIFLPSFGFIFDFKSPLRQNPSYKPVFGFLAPHSESALFSRNRLTCARILLKEQFWTLSGSLKAPGWLKVLWSLDPIQARLFLPFKGPTGVFRDPLMISGTIKASPMKLCTVIVLLKAYQNTKRNFKKYDLWRHNNVITKNNGKIRTSAKPGKLYIIRKEMMRALRKCNFYWNWGTESKVMVIEVKF